MCAFLMYQISIIITIIINYYNLVRVIDTDKYAIVDAVEVSIRLRRTGLYGKGMQ